MLHVEALILTLIKQYISRKRLQASSCLPYSFVEFKVFRHWVKEDSQDTEIKQVSTRLEYYIILSLIFRFTSWHARKLTIFAIARQFSIGAISYFWKRFWILNGKRFECYMQLILWNTNLSYRVLSCLVACLVLHFRHFIIILSFRHDCSAVRQNRNSIHINKPSPSPTKIIDRLPQYVSRHLRSWYPAVPYHTERALWLANRELKQTTTTTATRTSPNKRLNEQNNSSARA